MRNDRDELADYSRGFASILVVLGHLLASGNNTLQEHCFLTSWVNYVHMPIFFFWAGFYSKKTIKQPFILLIKEKSRRILVPFLSWSFVASSARILQNILAGTPFVFHTFVTDYTHTLLYGTSIWFLLSLFCCFIAYSIIEKAFLSNSGSFKVSSLLSLLLLLALACFPTTDLLCIHITQQMIIYFALGSFAFSIKEYITNYYYSHSKILALLSTGIVLLSPGLTERTKAYSSAIGIHYILYSIIAIVLSCSCVICLVAIANRLERIKKILLVVGRYSLEIYVLHMFFVKYIPIPVPESIFGNSTLICVAFYVVYSGAICGMCILLSVVLDKIPLYRKIMLGKK